MIDEENNQNNNDKKTEMKRQEMSFEFVKIFINRPVGTFMFMMLFIVLGLFSYLRLGVDSYPDIEFPFVTVQTTLAGASPEEVETSISKELEESINTVDGIKNLYSTSIEGFSSIAIEFELEKDGDVATQEVRDKVNMVLAKLPEGTESPIVQKLNMGATPVLTIATYADMDLIELTETVKKKIKENIENVSGVGTITIIGGREREIHVEVDPLKLYARQLTVEDVRLALIQENLEMPGGRVENENKEYGLRVLGRIDSVEGFGDIIVSNKGSIPIRISDVARVVDTGEQQRSISYINGKRSVALEVRKQSGANVLEVIKNIKKRLKKIDGVLPESVEIKILSDKSEYIKSSIHTVQEHLILGAILASLTIFFFLGNVGTTIIAAFAIPISIIGAFTFMNASNFTINNMTLLGLTVAIGLVVDDAIVMLENIYRHMKEYGKTAMQAAYDGAKEIGFAIVATTLALLVIFVPLAYMEGIVGRFVRSYGLTIAFAVGISAIVALTFTPMLCSKFLKTNKEENKIQKIGNKTNGKIANFYIGILKWALGHRLLMAVFSIGLILSCMFGAKFFMGVDFLPVDDTGRFQVIAKAPEGTTLTDMSKIFRNIENDVKKLPAVVDVITAIGLSSDNFFGSAATSNEGYMTVEMKDLKDRKVTVFQNVAQTRYMLSRYKDLTTKVSVVADVGGGDVGSLEYIVTGPDMDKLHYYATTIADEVAQIEGFKDVDISFSDAKPEYNVIIDRNKAKDMGVSVQVLSQDLRMLVGGEDKITKYKEGSELYQVRIRADEKFRISKEGISAISVTGKDDEGEDMVVRLDSVATIVEGAGPTNIDRKDRQRQITISANLEGIDKGKALKKFEQAFAKLKPSAEYEGKTVGQAEEMVKMLKNFFIAFLLSSILIYIILASQFESFTYPISIMTAIPLTIPLAFVSLIIFRQNLNLFSILGVFILVGIVCKNAILQIDYTNTLRARGLERLPAILQANRTRLRPILMTTLTLIASMMPTAVGTGVGSGIRRSMAIAIIGGQVLALLITLLMTPVMYSLLDDLQEWLRRKLGFTSSSR